MRAWLAIVVAACGSSSDPTPPPVAPAIPDTISATTGPIEHAGAVEIRRGELAMPRGPMKFALVGDGDTFDRDDEFIAFDLDRDGAMDTTHLTSAELFHVFEHALTLDGEPWSITIAPDGSRLALRHLSERLLPRPRLVVGSLAPDARVTAGDAVMHLSEYEGQVVLLDFWSTTCKPCIEARPRLRALRERLHARGFEIVSVLDDADAIVGSDGVGVEAHDLDAEATYRIDRFPSYFVIDRAGKLACAHCTLDALEPMLDGLLATALPAR